MVGLWHIWIGANTSTPGSGITSGWKWVDGSPFAYTNWDIGQPDDAVGYCQQAAMTNDTSQSCLEIFSPTISGMRWDDGCCSEVQPFVCQKPVAQFAISSSSTPPIGIDDNLRY
jgi:hypothetical protein